jgi:hypothetical protein
MICLLIVEITTQIFSAAEKGPVARVEENGIVLKSDSVSADQLAEIQRHIMDSLRAKGIDPAAVMADLNSVGGNFTAPRRRPAPPQSSSANNHNNNRNGMEMGTLKIWICSLYCLS